MSPTRLCPTSPIAVLSGPTFAHEVAAGLPTAVTLACRGRSSSARRSASASPCRTFRIYLSDDVAGAEVGGAVKNVLAIACGVVEGKGLGQNARAALIARGFAEMTRFGLAYGRAAGNPGRPVRPRRPCADLLLDQLAQLLARQGHRRRPLGRRADGRPPHRRRRRLHRAGAARGCAEERGVDMPIVAAVDDSARGPGRASTRCFRNCSLGRPRRGSADTRNRPRCPSFPSRRSGSGRACPLRRRAGDGSPTGSGFGHRRRFATDNRAPSGALAVPHAREDVRWERRCQA